MEIKGKVIAILAEQSGQGKNGEWRSQDFILETSDQYPKKVCINLFGDKIAMMPEINQDATVSFDIESREYNGRWFTTVRAWKVEVENAKTNDPVNQIQPSASEGDDSLPF